MSLDSETVVITVAYLEELRERARAWRLEAERLQAELLRVRGVELAQPARRAP